VDLFEGNQRIIVVATDDAGNAVMVTRDVICDTKPPEFQITDPLPGVECHTNQTEFEKFKAAKENEASTTGCIRFCSLQPQGQGRGKDLQKND
jgi:hypothetical protein